MKKCLFVVASIVLCFISTNFAQQPTTEKLFKIRGTVKNQDKISLAGLNLFFEGKEIKKTFVSDEKGLFTAELPVGKYKITANSAVSKNFIAFVEIFDNNLNPTDFELILETEKFCCSQMSDGNVTEIIKYVAPPYPPAARATRVTGEVVLTVKIDKEGKVISSKIESGHPLLRTASEQAVKQWLFSIDENGTEREGKIVIVFVGDSKEEKQTEMFIKPNRLEVFAPSSTINF